MARPRYRHNEPMPLMPGKGRGRARPFSPPGESRVRHLREEFERERSRSHSRNLRPSQTQLRGAVEELNREIFDLDVSVRSTADPVAQDYCTCASDLSAIGLTKLREELLFLNIRSHLQIR